MRKVAGRSRAKEASRSASVGGTGVVAAVARVDEKVVAVVVVRVGRNLVGRWGMTRWSRARVVIHRCCPRRVNLPIRISRRRAKTMPRVMRR